MDKKFWFIPMGILALWLLGCAPREAPAPVAPPSAEVVKPEVKERWQVEWDKTLQAARKEGRVVVYSGGSAIIGLKEAIPLFREKFGLSLEVIAGVGGELGVRLQREKAAGLNLADFLITGSNTIIGTIKQAGITVPMEPALIFPEVLDPKAWFGGKFPWQDKDRHLAAFFLSPTQLLAINTELVKPGEIKSFYDLLEPRWKDKVIINNPTRVGTAFNSFSTMLLHKMVDLDYYRRLVRNQSMVVTDQRLQGDWLAKGKYPVALWPHTGRIDDFFKAGAPIDYIDIKEGTLIGPGGSVTALIAGTPHPNAARVFLNWLFSKEGQTLMQYSSVKQSAREDIPTDKIEAIHLRQKGVKYFFAANSDEEWILREQDNYLKMAREVFASLLR